MIQVELWSDGSGTANGEPGGWAYVLRKQQSDGSWIEKEESGPCSATSNNRMELMGIIMGLRALKQPCQVTIFADSQYATNPIKEKWLGKWKNRNWTKVKNVDLMKELDRLNAVHDITINWVRGHNGTELNERCDKLAGAQRRVAIESPDVWFPEPAGERTFVQPALLNPDDDSHLVSIAGV